VNKTLSARYTVKEGWFEVRLDLVLRLKALELAVAMDNHNDVESVLENAGLLLEWMKK